MFKKIGVLSLSIVTGAITAITTIIPLILKHYPGISISRIETLVTISSLSALLTILFNNKLVEKFGLKKTILSGLVIGMIAGVIPFFFFFYPVFFISRIILGLGVGMYSPHAITLISILYKGSERANLLGVQMGVGAFGNSILLFFSGWLAKMNWRYTFFTYLWLGIVALLVWLLVPEVHIDKIKDKKSTKSLSHSTIKYLILSFVTFLIIWGVQLKIPTFLYERGIVSSEKAGLILGVMNIAGMLAGLSFGLMYKKFKLFLLPIGFLLAALSVFGMINSYSWMMIFIFAVLFNFVYSFTGPTIVLQVNQQVEEYQLTKVNSLITMTTILSSYAAPIVWNNLSKIIDFKEGSVLVPMYIMILSLFFCGLFLMCYTTYKLRYKGE